MKRINKEKKRSDCDCDWRISVSPPDRANNRRGIRCGGGKGEGGGKEKKVV